MKNYTYLRRKLCLLFLLFIYFSPPSFSQQIAKGFTAKNGEYYGFYEYKPAEYASTTTQYPLIIFLHGGGEKGNGTTQLSRVASVGGTPPKLIADGNPMKFTWNGKTEYFIVLSPQCNDKYGWWQDWQVAEILDYALKNLRVDPDRIFLTGLSMGGGGTWQYAGRTLANAKQFAALGVSCGACSDINFCNFANANLPVWAFHAMNDGAIPVTCTQAQIDKIKACNPAVQPYMTIWPDGDHGIWGRVYDVGYTWQNPNLYEWFLGQNRGKPVNKRPVANAADQTITATPGTATLDASGSTDADGKIVRYIWTRKSGPATGTITTPVSTDGKTTVTGLTTTGTYTYEVKVVDDRADWVTKTVTVTVNPGAPGAIKPIAKAGDDIMVYTPASTATLDGSASYHPDGKASITKYAWTQLSGPVQAVFSSTTAIKPTISGLSAGVYTFRLTVTDNYGNTAYDDVTVTVKVYNIYPAVSAGDDITIILPTSSVTLDASGSKDPDGSLKAFEWTYVSGPSKYTIVSPSAISTVVKDLVEGVYSFKVRVWDNLFDSANDTVKITVKAASAPVNQAPVADAGKDITITLPTSNTTLNGTASSDPENKIASYAWTRISGPTSFKITDAAAASTALTGLVEGVYKFQLVVTDDKGLTDKDTVQVTVNPAPPPPNQAPVANAGKDITITLPTSNTTLNGSASSDPENKIASYAWSRISGPTSFKITDAAAASTALTGLVEGIYKFQLVVTDDKGLTDKDTVQVTVNPAPPPPNKAPVADAGEDISITLPNNEATLDGSASSDPENKLSSYSWKKTAGPADYAITDSKAATTKVTGLAAGNYTFVLTVTDSEGLSDTDTVSVFVLASRPANQPPVANAGKDITITLPTSNTTLNGSASSDPENSITSYAWSRISGPTSFKITNTGAATTALTGLVEGVYKFRLVVTDADGLTDSDTVQVTVNPAPPPPNQAPVANAGKDITITLPTSSTTLNGSASADPDGTIVSYAWTRISGPTQHTIAKAAEATTTLSNLVQGTYKFRLVVTDNGGLTASDTVQVTVKPAPNKAPIANAGTDIVITLPASSTALDGSASSDPDGSIKSWTWSWISGPTQYTIATPNAANTALTNLAEGTYAFKLQVTDNNNASSYDTVQVTVQPEPNKKPVAKAGSDLSVYLPNPVIKLDGSASSDPDGSIKTWAWTRVSGTGTINITNANKAEATVTGVQAGKYVFELTVTDNKGAQAKDQVTVTVLPQPNLKPVADAGKDTGITVPASTAFLNGAGSHDPDGVITQISWKKVQGPASGYIESPGSVSTAVGDLVAGEYIFELTVTDNKGGIGKDSVTVSVVNNFRYEENISVYPNPIHSGELNLRCMSDSLGQARITIYDISGRLVHVYTGTKSQQVSLLKVPVADLKAGIYYIEVRIDNRKRLMTKFVKQ